MEKSRHSSENPSKHGFLKILIIVIIFLAIVCTATVIWYNTSLSGTGSKEEKAEFVIEMGSGTDKIANILEENGVIKSKLAFKLYVKLNNISNFKAGSYTITKDMSVPEIATTLQTGVVFKETGYNITFVEGKTIDYIAKVIAENTDNTEQDVYDLLKDEEYIDSLISEYWFITDEIKNKDIYYPLEGYLFPDTYSFDEKDVSVKDIFKTMLDQMKKVLDNYKSDIESSNYSVHEILTMASVIENEAVFDKDRKDVASVFYNRLNAKMSLGSDVTTYYAFKIELGSRDLNKSEIDTYNPYNTRGPNMSGKLPVGPISTVRQSIN